MPSHRRREREERYDIAWSTCRRLNRASMFIQDRVEHVHTGSIPVAPEEPVHRLQRRRPVQYSVLDPRRRTGAAQNKWSAPGPATVQGPISEQRFVASATGYERAGEGSGRETPPPPLLTGSFVARPDQRRREESRLAFPPSPFPPSPGPGRGLFFKIVVPLRTIGGR